MANQACHQGVSAAYLRMPKFSKEMAIAHGRGRYAKLLAQWARTDIVVLDDRHGTRSTIVNSQITVENWHGTIGDPTLADAMLDRARRQSFWPV